MNHKTRPLGIHKDSIVKGNALALEKIETTLGSSAKLCDERGSLAAARTLLKASYLHPMDKIVEAWKFLVNEHLTNGSKSCYDVYQDLLEYAGNPYGSVEPEWPFELLESINRQFRSQKRDLGGEDLPYSLEADETKVNAQFTKYKQILNYDHIWNCDGPLLLCDRINLRDTHKILSVGFDDPSTMKLEASKKLCIYGDDVIHCSQEDVVMYEPGLFALTDHLERLSATGGPLEALDRQVDFEAFRLALIWH